MSKRIGIVVCAAMVLLFAARLSAQEPQMKTDVYDALKYRYIGPEGNRADSVAGIPGNPNIYYVGAASGGIFKTTDAGIHWDPIFDSEAVASIGSLAIAATDPNIVWAGTGEPYIRSHISVGQGIYKSLDAGKTWKLMGLEKTGRIGNVIIDPRNPDIVLACALGHAYGPQPERGVFRTTDGGKTWDKVLFVDENTGCSDMGMDPNNPRILFAGMWQIEIHTWGRTSGGPGSALYKSTDGGVTWKKLEGHGLPHPPIGRIAVRVAKKDSNRVYAEIETGDGVPHKDIPGFPDAPGQLGQLWRSDDGGDSWQMVNSDRQIRDRTHYYTREEISPDNENEVYFFAASFSRTLDGGATLTKMPQPPAGDHHEMWIDPTDGDRMAVVHDGGVSISVNRGKTWNRVSLPIAQMYHVTVDDQIPYYVYGNRQDGPSWRGPSNSLQFGGFFGNFIPRGAWHDVAGGESGFAVPDPVDNNIIWSTGTGTGSVGGTVTRFDERTLQHREVEVWPDYVAGDPAADVKYRFNWEFPIAISPFDHNKIYVGSQFVHVTTDGGNSWQVISPDLTRNDKSRQQISGGLTPDDIGVEYAGVIFALSESPKEQGLLWAGTNDGYVQVSRDGGKTWTNVTKNIPGLPEWGTVDNIEPSRYDAGTAYLTVDMHQVNNRDPWVFKTTDYGKTWTNITHGIPHSMLSYAHCVKEDPVRKGLLYLGTEGGLYVSFNDGKDWQPLQSGLPHAPVYWMTVQERFHDLAVATYGRGFWILDDITPLQQLTPQVLSASAHLFAPRDAYRFQGISEPASVDYDASAGKNPPYGASISFYLKENLKDKEVAKLTFSDSSGKAIRTIECKGAKSGSGGKDESAADEDDPDPDPTPCEAKAGINRFWWDLQGERSTLMKLRTPPQYAPDVQLGPEGYRKNPAFGRLSVLALPGTYTVTLTVGGQTMTQKLNVIKDPRTTGTETDIQAQHKLQTEIWEATNKLSESVNQLESLRAQLAAFSKEMGSDDASKAAKKSADDLAEKLTTVESKLLQLKLTGRGQDDCRWPPMLLHKLAYVSNQLDSSADFAPTTQQSAVFEYLKGEGDKVQQEFQHVLSTDVAAFNAMLREKGIANIITKTK